MSTEASVRMTFREAYRAALHEALQSDPKVVLLGEDVGAYGGCYAVSKGFLAEFGPERVRDTPLSELAFVGIGVGAAIAGLRPIVEVMTVNFSLLALDQVVNNAATLRHMSGGQVSVPLVLRIATGAGRQVAAQHSHSFEGLYAHIPGLRVLAPGTVEDARGMLAPALREPNPVLIFEHAMLYAMEGELPKGPVSVDIDRAKIRRPGHDVSLVAYGGSVHKALAAAQALAQDGIDAEVVDLRTLRPLDDETVIDSVRRTRRAVIVDEGWQTGSLAAEVSARIMEQAFYELDAPVQRVCTLEVPIPYAKHLEDAALPSPERIVQAAKATLERAMGDFTMPSLGADMEAGTLVEWKVKPGDAVKRGDIVAVVETQKGAIDVEIFQDGRIEALLVQPGAKVPVGAVLARLSGGEAAASPAAVAQAAPAPAEARRSRASPAAKAAARALGVTLEEVRGTGPGGAIGREDVERAAAAHKPAAPGPRREMRQAIAAAMSRSKREIPHYYLATRIDVGRALEWVRAHNAPLPPSERVLPIVLFLKAVALAAGKVREVNGFYDGQAFRPGPGIHLGVATSLREGGLVVPALHDVDTKTLDGLAHDLTDLIERARRGLLRSSELSDATLTVTSLGERGVEEVFGVIFPPQVALVGFGAIADQPRVVEGRCECRPCVTATLAADHRVSDGHRGGLFLAHIAELLQSPERL